MRFEVWEYEYTTSYELCPAKEAGERERALQEDGRLVLIFEAETWDEAKRKENDYISAIRRELME